MRTAKQAYNAQKWHAAKNKIAFEFTFERWCRWWHQKLGPDWLIRRGKKRGQYVMLLKKDEGPYSPRNVKCVKMEAFVKKQQTGKRYGSFHPNAKLTFRDVIAIRSSLDSNKALAEQFSVSYITVWKIRSYARWKHIR